MLAVLGAAYTVGAIVVFVMLAMAVWNAISMTSLAMMAALAAAAACGIWFLKSALQNLGIRIAGGLPRGLPHLTHRSSGSH
ncbi:MAG TPA: hypothetical protein VF432_23655 [Thermoanaerobaculia bacterium]